MDFLLLFFSFWSCMQHTYRMYKWSILTHIWKHNISTHNMSKCWTPKFGRSNTTHAAALFQKLQIDTNVLILHLKVASIKVYFCPLFIDSSARDHTLWLQYAKSYALRSLSSHGNNAFRLHFISAERNNRKMLLQSSSSNEFYDQ